MDIDKSSSQVQRRYVDVLKYPDDDMINKKVKKSFIPLSRLRAFLLGMQKEKSSTENMIYEELTV
jgi:hypothetical protein